MERIVIYSSSEDDRGLEKVLKALFPECEICRVQVCDRESGRGIDAFPSGAGIEKKEKKSSR